MIRIVSEMSESYKIDVDLIKRHGSHHFINVKYGYIVLFISLIHVGFIFFSKKLYLRKWITSGRSTTFKRLNSIPDSFVLILWSVIIVSLCFYKFHVDQISSFVKRLGRLSYALLPLDIFFSLKPTPLPDIYYLELIFLHKWLSRIIVILGLAHSAGFVIIWLKKGEFIKTFKVLNLLGVTSAVLFFLATSISLKPIRRRFYKAFFSVHLISVWVSVILLHFHARPGVTLFTLINSVLFISQIVVKVYKSSDVQVKVFSKEDSNLQIIQFINQLGQFTPGSHLRLSYPRSNALTYLLPSHPYTIASRKQEREVKLIIKRTAFGVKDGNLYSIFGPFPSLHENFYKTADRVLLVAGGSGLSYVLGIYSELVQNSSVSVTLVWITRNENDLWVLDNFVLKHIEIFITGTTNKYNDLSLRQSGEEYQLLNNVDDFELEDLNPFEDSKVVESNNRILKYGRPDFGVYRNKLNQFDKANNWVISCGSKSLNNSCKEFADSEGVRFHSEIYDL